MAAPRFIVGGSFRARSKPPKRLTRASPLPTSLPCESRSVHARPLTEAGSASTSPRGPAPSRRSQPFTRTSSPGRYIFRSSNTQKRSESVRAVLRQPAPSLHQPVSDGRIATSFPRRATSSGAGASPRASRASPEASVRAEPGPGRPPVPGRTRATSTSPSGRPSARSLAHATRVSWSANASSPMRVAWTHAWTRSRRRSFEGAVGRTTRITWPSPPSRAGVRSSRVSVSASGSPPTRTVVSITRRPGGDAASSRQPFCRYACHAAQCSGPTA